MDPNKTWITILQHIADEEWDEAISALKALARWIKNDGFLPTSLAYSLRTGTVEELILNLIEMCETMCDLEREDDDGI